MTVKKFLKRVFAFAGIAVLAASFSTLCSAEGPYNNYTYNAYDESVPTAAGYLPEKMITGVTLGIGDFNNPSDIYYDNKANIYLLDSGNSRIVVMSASTLELERVINPVNADGSQLVFSEATGIFVRGSGEIYIADKGAGLVYILDSSGRQTEVIGKPDSDLLSDDFDYRPSKVLVDSNGIVYVISYGCYSGALQFDDEHNFLGFYGSESVTMTAELVLQKMWKKIVPKSMSKNQARAVPVNYNNFDIDSEDMIYTTRNDVDSNVSQVRKLNYYGNSLLVYQTAGKTRTYGDIETYYDTKNGLIQSIISDIDVDPDGFFTILDTRRNRIFQFDRDSNMLFAFGGTSSQLGCFSEASAIETIGSTVLVVDSKNLSVTVFKPTEFGELVREASALMSDGKYSQCKDICNEILKYDSKYTLANIGLGKAFQSEGKYKESLEYFENANDTLSYSNSFYEYRSAVLNDAFVYIMCGILLLAAVWIVASRIRSRHAVSDYYLDISVRKYPFYVMKHPFKGQYSLRESGKGSLTAANIIVFLFFAVNIFVRQNTSFLFSSSGSADFNILYTFVGTVGIFAVMVLCNWAVGTLSDGEGKLKNIWISCAYALMPYVVLMIPITLISNVLVLDEGAFYYVAVYAVYAWVAIGIVMAVHEVQQFSLGKTVFAILLTVLGIIIVAALYAMAYSMLTQLISFIVTVTNEMLMRI